MASHQAHTVNAVGSSDLFTQTFGEMADDENYPSSEQKRRESPEQRKDRKAKERAEVRAQQSWDAHPERRTIRINGVPTTVELFTIGALAKALNKKPVTIRKWMAKGWLPQAQFRDKATGGAGQKRYWTRQQIEAIVAIAREEGLLDVWHPDITQLTRFAERVSAVFRVRV